MSAEAVAYQTSDEQTPVRVTAAAALVVMTGLVPDAERAPHAAAKRQNRRTSALQPPEEPLTPQGFSDLYVRLRQPIERYVSYMFNLSWQDAEDIAASAFENAFKALYPGRVVNQPTDWMYQIARRKAIDFMRHRRVVPMQSLSEPTGDVGLTLADTLLSPDDDETLTAVLDRRRLLAHIFGNLPPRYATIIRLYDHEGYSHDEIVGIMKITRANSKTMLNRARDRAKVLAAEYLSGHVAVKRRSKLVVD